MFPNGCGCFNVFHGCCLHLHHGNLTFPTCRLANSIGNCCVSLMISDSWMFLEDGQITVWYSSRLERKRDIPGVFSRFFLQTRNSECSAPRLPFAHMPILCPSTGLMSREEIRAAATTWLLTPINKKKESWNMDSLCISMLGPHSWLLKHPGAVTFRQTWRWTEMLPFSTSFKNWEKTTVFGSQPNPRKWAPRGYTNFND